MIKFKDKFPLINRIKTLSILNQVSKTTEVDVRIIKKLINFENKFIRKMVIEGKEYEFGCVFKLKKKKLNKYARKKNDNLEHRS